jgi:hypothetical protein
LLHYPAKIWRDCGAINFSMARLWRVRFGDELLEIKPKAYGIEVYEKRRRLARALL